MPVGLTQLADLRYGAPLLIVSLSLTIFDLDVGFAINHAMFARNGRCGWLLKPEAIQTRNKNALGVKRQRILSIDVRVFYGRDSVLVLTQHDFPDHIWAITATAVRNFTRRSATLRRSLDSCSRDDHRKRLNNSAGSCRDIGSYRDTEVSNESRCLQYLQSPME